MIKEMKIENIEISDGEKNIVAQNVQGKILKVLFIPAKGNHGVRLRIFTKEGELVMDVTQKGLYYPRANVSSEKMLTSAFSHEGYYKDYYYFNKELLFNITTSEPNFEGIVIDKLVLIYEEATSKIQQMQMVILSRILQEIINSKQEEFESDRKQTRLFR
ncbi:hypothetical protein LCGC14_2499000 [marine sediment metagenome]|uniref:Uncharacterized protein n=1 Tax=marine sediment metagenome TaxID=412755 RepID=A0A0F9B2C5_9ZZZZ